MKINDNTVINAFHYMHWPSSTGPIYGTCCIITIQYVIVAFCYDDLYHSKYKLTMKEKFTTIDLIAVLRELNER